MPFHTSFRSPRSLEDPVQVEDLNAIVPGIPHEHLPPGINGDAVRSLELPVRGPFGAPFDQKRPLRIEFLDAVIAGIHHIDVS